MDAGSSGCSGLIENCIFTGNYTDGDGGAVEERIFGNGYVSQVLNCDFFNNHADIYSGAYEVRNTNPEFNMLMEGCLFDGNLLVSGRPSGRPLFV